MIKLLIQIPDKWIEEEDLGFLERVFESKKRIEELVKEKLTDEVIKKIEVPSISIENSELKQEVLDKLVQKFLDEFLDNK